MISSGLHLSQLVNKYRLVWILQWRHHGHNSVSNHQPHDCLLNRLFRRRSKKTSKLRVTGLCAGNSPQTGEFSAQMATNAENASIWWRHHDKILPAFVNDSTTVQLNCAALNKRIVIASYRFIDTNFEGTKYKNTEPHLVLIAFDVRAHNCLIQSYRRVLSSQIKILAAKREHILRGFGSQQ